MLVAALLATTALAQNHQGTTTATQRFVQSLVDACLLDLGINPPSSATTTQKQDCRQSVILGLREDLDVDPVGGHFTHLVDIHGDGNDWMLVFGPQFETVHLVEPSEVAEYDLGRDYWSHLDADVESIIDYFVFGDWDGDGRIDVIFIAVDDIYFLDGMAAGNWEVR